MSDAFETLPTIDISWKRGFGLAKRLSNLAPRPFVLQLHGHERRFASIEGALQSLKFRDRESADAVAGMHGGRAWVFGQSGNDWKLDQMLHWLEYPYWRHGISYQNLLDAIYLAAYRQNEEFREALAESVGSELAHDGVTDPKNTVLTPIEYLTRLERLRDGKLSV